MKRNIVVVVTAAAMFAGFNASVSAADKETGKERQAARADKADIDARIQAINRLDNSPARMQAGMAAVSKQTAVPLQKIQAEHKEHPRVGLAGLFVAHELATRTHKSVEHFLKAHQEGKSWAAIAAANGESLDTLENKLIQIESAMRDAK